MSFPITALIPCAGMSRRMAGRCKALLEIDGLPILQRIINSYREAGIHSILAVFRNGQQELITLAEDNHISYAINEAPEKGMFSSIKVGLRRLPVSSRAFFLQPCDMPFVEPSNIRDMASLFFDRQCMIVMPEYIGQTGHPPLISTGLAKGILGHSGVDGLRGFLKGHHQDTVFYQCSHSGVVSDIDTEEDYFMLLRYRQGDKRLPVSKGI